MTRVTRLIHNAGKYLLISIFPLPTHPTHNFTHKNGGNLDTLAGWPKKMDHNRPARCAGQQATGLDAWTSRVKCPARFVSHLHDICIYIWVVYSLCFFCFLFITVTWWYVWCIEWASGNQEEVQACLVTLWLFIISCYSLYKTTLGLLCSWFENNPNFHKYSMNFHV